MHMLSGIFVYAEDEKGALERAREVLEEGLVGDYREFDYYREFGAVMRADSPSGRKFIEERMEWRRKEVVRALKTIMEFLKDLGAEDAADIIMRRGETYAAALALSSEPLFNAIFEFEFACYRIGRFRGPSIWLYDEDAEGIKDYQHLKDALRKWNKKDDLNVYIVPVDVHF